MNYLIFNSYALFNTIKLQRILIKYATIVNEGQKVVGDLLIKDGFIVKIASAIAEANIDYLIEAAGKYVLPGVIDDQVHFRQPGLTHKAQIYTEAKAAVAGGVTSFMEMPNTLPNTTTNQLLEKKCAIAAKESLANYAFFLGGTNDNLEELLSADKKRVCGIKLFMGSSTGNMLVDHPKILEKIFSHIEIPIATHCEDTPTILKNESLFREKYGGQVPIKFHPTIRSTQACYLSSAMAVALAKKYKTKLHVLHISTAKELTLFDNTLPLVQKAITAEACIHHLWFSDRDYEEKGTLIKWNPAIKQASDRTAILQAVVNDTIDIIATDHAPHTLAEKQNDYFNAPSGGPLVQHGLLAMLDLHKQGKISLEKIVEKMCHNPAIRFQVEGRGFIREGYWADLAIVDLKKPHTVSKENLYYKCGWSPFEGHTFTSTVTHTLVSGNLAYENRKFNEANKGKRLKFIR